MMVLTLRIFNPQKVFRNKRIAIVGAADSVVESENGKIIDDYDIVIRLNKAPHSWSPIKADYLGTKFTYLYHSFFENEYSGGGAIDWELYDKLGIEKLINPNFSKMGLTAHLNYFKRNFSFRKTHILSKRSSDLTRDNLDGYTPTVGLSALLSVLQSRCSEIYITGFTFFKTPYADGYRAELQNLNSNQSHIKDQGLHDPKLEFEVFKKALRDSHCNNIKFDRKLEEILHSS